MGRPPKKYVCEKCGYLGNTSEHEGCDYLAWTTGEQRYIDQLERDLALLKASPASVPGWKLVPDVPTSTMVLAGEKALSEHDFLRMDSAYCAMLASAPTPPVSEDQKDAERYHKLANYMIGTRFDIDDALVAASSIDEISSILDAMQEDKP